MTIAVHEALDTIEQPARHHIFALLIAVECRGGLFRMTILEGKKKRRLGNLGQVERCLFSFFSGQRPRILFVVVYQVG